MKQLKSSILQCLQELKGSGKFADVQIADFVLPGLQVEGVGDIAFPLQEFQAGELIKVARKSPFGKGRDTILDSSVRSGWEIDADKLNFANQQWSQFINKTIEKVKIELGLEEYTVEANLYKLLLYEEGDFFLPHKDSEKESGMFGTLIVGLPSNYSGGELVIRFEGEEVVADFANPSDHFSINIAAFYADCDHEVKPLKSGYRISLVYNLVQRKSGKKIELKSIHHHADILADIITKHPLEKPYIVLLGHQYTPENFSYDHLKLNDRCRADALLLAAKKLGYYSKLCLVTSFKAGIPDYDGYYEYGEDGGDDDALMEEVYEEWLEIESWCGSQIPHLNTFRFEEDDLITSFELDKDEPIVKESSGYMGNYGPDLSHWYHYGAVVIWSPDQNAQFLRDSITLLQLEWIGYFNRSGQVSPKEKKAVDFIIKKGLNDKLPLEVHNDFNVVADWLTLQDDKAFFLKAENKRIQLLFEYMSKESWQKIWEWLPEKHSSLVFEKLADRPGKKAVEKLFAVIRFMASNLDTVDMAKNQTAALPQFIENIDEKDPIQFTAAAISDLIWIDRHFSPGEEWVKAVSHPITSHRDWQYIHGVLGPQLSAEKKSSPLLEVLLDYCKEYLRKRVTNKPEPPADWSRPVPDSKHYSYVWKMLKSFLESPVEQIYDFKRVKADRDEVEYALKNGRADLKTSTIRKGSPHTLRITKTQATYDRKFKKWQKDVDLLGKLDLK